MLAYIETHCHTYHSFDCNTTISDVVASCERRSVKGIVVCDHDVCGITPKEEKMFVENGICLYRAIEFTTKTDAHIIGVSNRIKELQQPRFHYGVEELIEKLQEIGACIIIPHPYHKTGIIGNGKISQAVIDKAFYAAQFVEKENYRYGKIQEDLKEKYPNLHYLIGSDAHSARDVGAFVNQVNEIQNDFLSTMLSGDISFHKNAEHGCLYQMMKSVKRSAPYQKLLHLFPEKLRRNIKNKLINR